MRASPSVFLGVGCMRGRDLQIPGVELDGVLRAVDFLLNANLGYRVELGDDVLVIGGGNVALDAARTALREIAAARVDARRAPDRPTTRRSRARSTADARRRARRRNGSGRAACASWRSRAARRCRLTSSRSRRPRSRASRCSPSGARRRSWAIERVAGLETLDVASVFDPDGRFNPRLIDGTEAVLECDSVILAIGQAPDLSWLGPSDGVELSPRGTIAVDRESLATSADWIYAGGDVAFGPRNLIDAIGDGRRAAASIHRQIAGEEPPVPVPSAGRKLLPIVEVPRTATPDYTEYPRVPIPAELDRSAGSARPRSSSGTREEQAREEASRCLQCFLNIMLEPSHLHPLRRLRRHLPRELHPHHPHGGDRGRRRHRDPSSALIIQEELCIRCGLCVDRCPDGRAVTGGMVRILDRPHRARADRELRGRDGFERTASAGPGVVPVDLPSGRGDQGERGLPVGHPSPAALDAAWPSADLVPELLPPPLPGEGATRGALVPIDAAARVHRGGAVRRPLHLGDVPDVLLSPDPPDAYFDMHALATTVAFGQFVRNIHRWSAHLMVLAVFAHLLRVFYAGAYKPPRQFNWVIGVFLLLGTLFLSFTGYLLPWDQLSYWAITVGTNIAGYVPVMGDGVRKMLLGGTEVGSATLLRFYVLHVYFVPALIGDRALHPHLARSQGRVRGRRSQDGAAARGRGRGRLGARGGGRRCLMTASRGALPAPRRRPARDRATRGAGARRHRLHVAALPDPARGGRRRHDRGRLRARDRCSTRRSRTSRTRT